MQLVAARAGGGGPGRRCQLAASDSGNGSGGGGAVQQPPQGASSPWAAARGQRQPAPGGPRREQWQRGGRTGRRAGRGPCPWPPASHPPLPRAHTAQRAASACGCARAAAAPGSRSARCGGRGEGGAAGRWAAAGGGSVGAARRRTAPQPAAINAAPAGARAGTSGPRPSPRPRAPVVHDGAHARRPRGERGLERVALGQAAGHEGVMQVVKHQRHAAHAVQRQQVRQAEERGAIVVLDCARGRGGRGAGSSGEVAARRSRAGPAATPRKRCPSAHPASPQKPRRRPPHP